MFPLFPHNSQPVHVKRLGQCRTRNNMLHKISAWAENAKWFMVRSAKKEKYGIGHYVTLTIEYYMSNPPQGAYKVPPYPNGGASDYFHRAPPLIRFNRFNPQHKYF